MLLAELAAVMTTIGQGPFAAEEVRHWTLDTWVLDMFPVSSFDSACLPRAIVKLICSSSMCKTLIPVYFGIDLCRCFIA